MTAWHRPVRLQVDYAAIARNTALIKRAVGPDVQIMAPVKANAYGHGAVPTAEAVLSAGAQRLAVANVDEALELREAGIQAPILILGASSGDAVDCAVRCGAALSLQSASQLAWIQKAAQREGKRAIVHIQADTGMSRLGLRTSAQLEEILSGLHAMPEIALEGIYTHFFDATNAQITNAQFARFVDAVARTRASGHSPLVHCAATEAALLWPHTRCDCIRPGIALYGGCADKLPGLTWAMRLLARPARIAQIESGETVGYGGTFCAERTSQILTVPIGYADGYPRALGGRAQVLIRGKRAPVVGRVCMDILMVDVTDIPGITMDDEIVLLGAQGNDAITPDEMADWAGTISYEIITGFHDRIARGDFDAKGTDSRGTSR